MMYMDILWQRKKNIQGLWRAAVYIPIARTHSVPSTKALSLELSLVAMK